jgi:hypothetical protein
MPILDLKGDRMDARGVQRLLEKIQGMAETADHVGMRNAEMLQREPRLSDAAKGLLAPLYAEHAHRQAKSYALLGLEICDIVQAELEDEQARALLELFRANLAALNESASTALSELGAAAKLG